MYHSWGDIIEHISEAITIYPGDVIGSGTVPLGCGLELGRWLEPGDRLELEVEGIGTLTHRIGTKY
jgi:2-keto-4-pentenoate hydratase/2-oxohepta-3-ene-1,7-dioic acid hydratase in catechol pathway